MRNKSLLLLLNNCKLYLLTKMVPLANKLLLLGWAAFPGTVGVGGVLGLRKNEVIK